MRDARSIALLLALTFAACGSPDDELGDDAGATVVNHASSDGGGAAATEAGVSDAGPSRSDASTPRSDAGTASAEAGAPPQVRDASAALDAAPSGGNDAATSRDAGDTGADATTASDSSTPDAGGSAECDWSAPPSDVAKWIDESWKSQLGSNIKNRKAWNLDNVMLNKGQLNLCVRWGATKAVPDMVKANLEATIERWFNDWFKGLGNYGCFPYGNGIKVKITGWAVRPGKQALLGQIDPAIPVYTETDAEGEPKCPDACSSFVHWDHKFPGCQGGDANHSDYWLWFDDTLPGGGGAAAVGGDWGLRMPVDTFLGAFSRKSFGICEHEMGHGFGFQDYYDWTGSRPQGGSLMIVGSSSNEGPTTGDVWLLRRTWKEMKALRGW